jgi:prepilin signal peptidase PulO-like enzyme (type II secretory pathway)
VNQLLALPLEVRLASLFVLGMMLGGIINWAIYALAWFPRPISPWQRPHPDAPHRQWADFVPVLGWLGLWRESKLHGAGFWLRPLLVELACGSGLAALYHWEISGQLAPPLVPPIAVPFLVVPPTAIMLHQQFACHALLIGLMLVATFIDFDEKTIPDAITIPGALWPAAGSGMVIASGRAFSAASAALRAVALHLDRRMARLARWLVGSRPGRDDSLAWCAPDPRWRRSAALAQGQFYFASIARDSAWWKMLLLAALARALWPSGTAGAGVASLAHGARSASRRWRTDLGRGSGRSLRKEAMGFGDVTLMAQSGLRLAGVPRDLLPLAVRGS